MPTRIRRPNKPTVCRSKDLSKLVRSRPTVRRLRSMCWVTASAAARVEDMMTKIGVAVSDCGTKRVAVPFKEAPFHHFNVDDSFRLGFIQVNNLQSHALFRRGL